MQFPQEKRQLELRIIPYSSINNSKYTHTNKKEVHRQRRHTFHLLVQYSLNKYLFPWK